MSTNNPVSLIPFDRSKNLNRGGRPKGSTNLAKRNAREAIKMLVEKNVPRVQEWLDTIEKEQGAQAAYRCFIDLVEYAVPKMSRNELTAEGGTVQMIVSWSGGRQPERGLNEQRSSEEGLSIDPATPMQPGEALPS